MPPPRLDELLDVLRDRSPTPQLNPDTGWPAAWAAWLRAQPLRVLAFTPEQIVAAIGPRTAHPLRWQPTPLTGFWSALYSLHWQQWEPPPREERGLRLAAAAGSAGLHLLFLLALLVLSWVRLPSPIASGEAGVQVTLIGTDEAGGTVDQPRRTAAAGSATEGQAPRARSGQRQAAPSASSPATAVAATPIEAATAAIVPSAVAAPSPPAPERIERPAAERLQVTELPRPTRDFQLPLPSPAPPVPDAAQPASALPALVVAPPAGLVVEVAPSLPSPVLPLREREVQVLRMTDVPSPRIAVREIAPSPRRSPGLELRERRVPEPPMEAVRAEPAMPTTSSPGQTPPSEPTPARSPVSSGPSADGRAQPSAAVAEPAAKTSASASAPASSGWEAPRRSDDWGLGPGRPNRGLSGLAEAAGRLGTAEGEGRAAAGRTAAARGAPGGDNDAWTRERIARSGTWLKRPPYDYTPTRFDQYWVPNESLLAEWVRKGLKTIEIPLPGSKNRIHCVISLLQFGGGCGLTNPDMQDQPASARPPPDIPFKKALQEDNGSRP